MIASNRAETNIIGAIQKREFNFTGGNIFNFKTFKFCVTNAIQKKGTIFNHFKNMLLTKTNWIYGEHFSSFVVRLIFYTKHGEIVGEQKTIFSYN